MTMKIFATVFFSLLMVYGFAQVKPNQFLEETNPSNANFEFYSQKNLAYRRASFTNVRKGMVPAIADTLATVPSATGNTSNLGEFVWDLYGGLWYIDGQGNAIAFTGGGPIYVTADTSAQITVYAPSHGLADTILLYGYVPVKADFTRANSISADSVFIAYAIDAPSVDSLTLVFSGVLVYGSWHGKAINVQYYLQDDGSEDITPGTVSMPTAIASDSTTIFLREVGVDIAGRLRRIAMPSPLITAFGGNPASPTDAVVQAAIEGAYLPAGLAQPGTIFTLSYATQSYNPSYQQTAPNTNPLTPSYAWLWDGVYATRIVNIPTSVDLEDVAYGVLGTLTLIPVSSLGSVPPTDSLVAMWLDTNYTTNGLRLANGSLLYYIDSGTRQNPDYIWQVIDDVSYDAGDTDWEKIIKRIYSVSIPDVDLAANGLTMSGDSTILGGTLNRNTTINGNAYGLTINMNSTSSPTLKLTQSASGYALNASAVGNTSIFSQSTNGIGVDGRSTNGNGVFGLTSSSSVAQHGVYGYTSTALTNSVLYPLSVDHEGGVPAAGFGAGILFRLRSSTTLSTPVGSIDYRWVDPTHATRTSAFDVNLFGNGTSSRRLSLAGTGQLTLDGYANNALNNVDSSLYVLTLDATGDVHSIPIDSVGGTGIADGNGIIDALPAGPVAIDAAGNPFILANTAFAITTDSTAIANAGESTPYPNDVTFGYLSFQSGDIGGSFASQGTADVAIFPAYNFDDDDIEARVMYYDGSDSSKVVVNRKGITFTADTLDATGVTTFLGFPSGSGDPDQTLSVSNDSLTISGTGNTVKLGINELESTALANDSITFNCETRYQKIFATDMTSASASVTVLITNPITGGVYTFDFSDIAGTQTIIWPSTVKDLNRVALGTVTYSGPFIKTMYYDGTNFIAPPDYEPNINFDADSVTTTTLTIDLDYQYQGVHEIDMTSATNLTLTVSNPVGGGAYTFHFLGVSGTDNVTWPSNFYDEAGTALGTDALTGKAGFFYTCYYNPNRAKYYCK